MNNTKIVFLLSTAGNPNNIKRIDEFIAHGYEVEVYSFFREYDGKKNPEGFEVNSMGVIPMGMPYIKRIGLMCRGINEVLRKTRKQECIYYIIRNDIALLFTVLCHRTYIFEEADMTHVNLNNDIVRKILEYRIRKIIRKSYMSVFRSAGFLYYHFGDRPPANTYVIPNRLHQDILKCRMLSCKENDVNHLRFGFVGAIRFTSVLNFAKVVLQNYPQHEVHFWGIFSTKEDEDLFSSLNSFPNYFYHGSFRNPYDLPDIYENIDLVISTYENHMNHRYAEPNKLYESIYFETPIIVSQGTYLAKRVKEYGVGYVVDAMNDEKIMQLVSSLSAVDIKTKRDNARAIDKNTLVNRNEDFFRLIGQQLKHV